jgi:hypothetical protein
MQKCAYLVILIAVLSCNKEKDSGADVLLREIKSDFSRQEFEYNNGILVKEVTYNKFCTTAIDEFFYVYQNQRLNKLETITRGIYSSLSAMCDPASGIHSDEQYEYDSQGNIQKVIRQANYTLFIYNQKGLVVKQVTYLPNGTPRDSATFSYDSRGNLVSESNSMGTGMVYEYDNKKNPFYVMKLKPGWISAFNTSPNNVIKGTGNFGSFERKIISYLNDLPLAVRQDDVTFAFVYQ